MPKSGERERWAEYARTLIDTYAPEHRADWERHIDRLADFLEKAVNHYMKEILPEVPKEKVAESRARFDEGLKTFIREAWRPVRAQRKTHRHRIKTALIDMGQDPHSSHTYVRRGRRR